MKYLFKILVLLCLIGCESAPLDVDLIAAFESKMQSLLDFYGFERKGYNENAGEAVYYSDRLMSQFRVKHDGTNYQFYTGWFDDVDLNSNISVERALFFERFTEKLLEFNYEDFPGLLEFMLLNMTGQEINDPESVFLEINVPGIGTCDFFAGYRHGSGDTYNAHYEITLPAFNQNGKMVLD